MLKLILLLIWIIKIHGNTNQPVPIFVDEPKGVIRGVFSRGVKCFLDKYI